MARLAKYLTICLVILLVVTSITQLTVNAQSIPKPSVPEFTIKYLTHPYYAPPTYQIDEYSGKNITLQEGHTIQNRTIELSIKNQFFTSYTNNNGQKIEMFYNISSKGHSGNNWYYYPTWLRTLPVEASSEEYTVLSFGLDVNYEEDNQYGFWYGDLSSGDKVDFRVQALVGYYNNPVYNIALEYNTFNGQESDWSNIQTITIPSSSSSVTPAPSSTNSQSSITPTLPPDTISYNLTMILFSIIVATLVISVISLVLYVRHLKRTKPQNQF